MLLHAKHASSTYNTIVIATLGTDVFTITLSKQSEIQARIFILTGTTKSVALSTHKLYRNAFIKLKKTECTKDKVLHVLSGFHCFTGCDSTSVFAFDGGHVKSMFKPYLGASYDVFGSTVSDWHIFTCHMYEKKNLLSKCWQNFW